MKKHFGPVAQEIIIAKEQLNISRAHALELTPQQKQLLDSIYDSLVHWCGELGIEPVNPEKLLTIQIPLWSCYLMIEFCP